MRTNKTTKLLALTLSLLMLFTMIPLSVSATGQTILQVAQSDGNGNYYLTENVTVTAMETTEFEGKLNGNGYTVTTTAPLFKSVNNATIENITVAATETILERAAVVKYISGNTTFRNVTNNANVDGSNLAMTNDYSTSVTSSDVVAGGIAASVIGSTANGTTVIFENCTNNGNITSTAASGTVSVGGILGAVTFHSTFGNGDFLDKANVEFRNCENRGAIGSKGNVGGIVGQPYRAGTVTLDGCVNTNTGMVTGTNVAGMIGAAHAVVNISNCVNYAAISGETASGMIGSARGATTIISCGNNGDITGTAGAAGIHAISGNNNTDALLYYCYNTATITSGGDGAGISERFNTANSVMIGCYNSGAIKGLDNTKENFDRWLRKLSHGSTCMTRDKNYYSDVDDDSKMVYSGSGWETATTAGATEFNENVLTSGELAFNMNTAIGKTVYYQNINECGAANDSYPVTDSTHGYVFDEDMDKELENGEKLYSLAFYTLKTASVRLNADGVSGLRFATAVNKADYAVLTGEEISLDFGTLITPNDYLVDADNDFGGLEDGKYLDVNSTATGADNFLTLKGEDNDTYYYFCGSITGIKEANYDWNYSAIGYIKIGDATVYSGEYATRNIQYVATAAYNDRQAAANDTYKYEIAAESEYAIDGVASYSPYSTAELQRIKVYL